MVAETIDQEYREIVSILEHDQETDFEDQYKIDINDYWEKKKKIFDDHVIEKQKKLADKHKEIT